MGLSIKRATKAIGFACGMWLLSLAGCATSPPTASTALSRTELSFNINKCQVLGPGLYQCPAIDKPICNPDYTGTPVECLHTDQNGSITVQQIQTQ